jgi:hypothetical protein
MGAKALAVGLVALMAAPCAFGATTITEGSAIEGRWEKGDKKQKYDWVDSYTYVGEAGEELWIPWSNNAGGYSGRLEIRGPGGFATKPSTDDAVSVRLPVAGKYTLSLLSSTPAGYRFTVHRVTTAQAPAALVAGQAVAGGFTTADPVDGMRVDTYSFTARAGESVVVRLEGQQTRVMARVKFSTHTPAALGEPGQPAALSIQFPAAGTYPVMVSGDGGNYRLVVEPQVTAKTAPAQPLRVGEGTRIEYSDQLPAAEGGGFAYAFAVEAKAGERLSVVRTTDHGVTVWGPDGKRVATQVSYDNDGKPSLSGESRLTNTDFTAPVAGTYRIEAPVRAGLGPEAASLRLVNAAEGAQLMAQARAATNVFQAQRRAKVADALRRGEQLMNSGDYDGAIAAFQQATALDSTDNQVAVAANFGAGLASYRKGGTYGYLAAKGYFETVLIYDPNNAAARTNRDLAAQADADYQRNQQLAYEQAQAQRRQENSQYFSNMLNAFATGVNLGNQINAANAPPPPPQAAMAAPSSAPSPSSFASTGQVSGVSPSSSGPGTRSFFDERTGKKCVEPGATSTETRSDGFNYRWEFTNTCDRGFRVFTTMDVVDPSHPPMQSAGIAKGTPQQPARLTMLCVYSKYNLRQSCKGYLKFEVRE